MMITHKDKTGKTIRWDFEKGSAMVEVYRNMYGTFTIRHMIGGKVNDLVVTHTTKVSIVKRMLKEYGWQ